jgi:hypothetical protein
MQWLDAVLASVPEDYAIQAVELPDGATKVTPLSDDLIPLLRAWDYTQEKLQETRKQGIDKAISALERRLWDPAFDEKAAYDELHAVVIDAERLERQEGALRTLLGAALWDLYPGSVDECVGATYTKDGWVVFQMPDTREEPAFGTLFAISTL